MLLSSPCKETWSPTGKGYCRYTLLQRPGFHGFHLQAGGKICEGCSFILEYYLLSLGFSHVCIMLHYLVIF